jgi:hypothetical protein
MPSLPLSEAELKLIKEAMWRYDPEKLDYSDRLAVGLSPHERIIAALWLYGTTPALDLVFKLRGKKA